MRRVVILDYGSGNVRSVERALRRVGAETELTADPHAAARAHGLLVPGVGALGACASAMRAVEGDRIIGKRLSGSRPVLGVCVGMQLLFERGTEHGETVSGIGEWPGTVERLHADVLPHMGWNTVRSADDSVLFAGLDAATRFYFVHSFAVREWELDSELPGARPAVSWANHGEDFVAAVENGPLSATQFHPEKSGDAGAELLRNWLSTL